MAGQKNDNMEVEVALPPHNLLANAKIISRFLFLSISIFSEPKSPSKKRTIGLMSRTNLALFFRRYSPFFAQIEGNQQHN